MCPGKHFGESAGLPCVLENTLEESAELQCVKHFERKCWAPVCPEENGEKTSDQEKRVDPDLQTRQSHTIELAVTTIVP